MTLLETCVWLIPAVLLIFCICNCIKPTNFPPGPLWLPFIGCLSTFQRQYKKHRYTHLVFQKLAKEYGPVIGLKLGKQKIVVVTNYEYVKKALCMKELDGRPDGFFFKLRSFGKRKGVLFTDGAKWSMHRQFTLRLMRNFGLGQNRMKENLMEEARQLVSLIHNQMNDKKVVISMETFFDLPVLNVLWTMFAGHRFSYDDEKVIRILNVSHKAFRIMDCMGGVMSHLPFLRFVCPELCGYNEIMRITNNLLQFLNEEISQHENQIHERFPQDLIDAFLLEMRTKRPDENSIFDREELLMLCMDLFMAGSETTSNTLSNMFLFLASNPDWLKKLQEDLDDVVGRNRPPQLNDISKLPRIEAFIAECQRFLTLAPLGVPHRATEDVWLNGYRIPKGTTTILSYYSVSNDSNCWDKPEEFRPERFINEGWFKQVEFSIPFGIGKRRCLGEILARGSLFIFLTTIIHHYNFEKFDETESSSSNGLDGFVIVPKPYKLVFHLRPDISFE